MTYPTGKIESELKYALTKNEHARLKRFLRKLPHSEVDFCNTYFDTVELFLRSKRIGIRLRTIPGVKGSIATLKYPASLKKKGEPKSLKVRHEFEREISQSLTRRLLERKKAPVEIGGSIGKILKGVLPLSAQASIVPIGTVHMTRLKTKVAGEGLELDRFTVFDETFYELEIETKNPKKTDFFVTILFDLCRVQKHPILTSKLARFLRAWKKKRGG